MTLIPTLTPNPTLTLLILSPNPKQDRPYGAADQGGPLVGSYVIGLPGKHRSDPPPEDGGGHFGGWLPLTPSD